MRVSTGEQLGRRGPSKESEKPPGQGQTAALGQDRMGEGGQSSGSTGAEVPGRTPLLLQPGDAGAAGGPRACGGQ